MAEQKANDNNNNIPRFSLKDGNFIREINGQNEKVIFGSDYGDRRVHVPNPYRDNRIIMRCIGRIFCSYTIDKYRGSVGTGTVFDFDHQNGWAYIITCAHNVRKKNDYDGQTVEAKILQFQCEKSNGYNSYLHHYNDVKIVGVYNYKHKKRDFNDLAILKFKDDGFYQKLFTENKGKIELYPSDFINKHDQDTVEYGIYGYPVPKDVHAKQNGVQDGQLWGMMAKYDNQGGNMKLYIRQSDNNQLWNYNAIDTEGGQSGSAIFVKLGDDGYGIVGIHTGGRTEEHKNWGVTLNKDKYEWADKTVKTDKEKPQNRNGNHLNANGYNNHHQNHANYGYGHNANQGGQFNNGNRPQMNNNNQNNPQQSENIETLVNQLVEMGFDGKTSRLILEENGCDRDAALEILTSQ